MIMYLLRSVSKVPKYVWFAGLHLQLLRTSHSWNVVLIEMDVYLDNIRFQAFKIAVSTPISGNVYAGRPGGPVDDLETF